MISGTQIVIVSLAASGLIALVGLQQFHKRASLARLQIILGGPSGKGMSGMSEALGWIGSHIPGGTDQSLQTALTRAGFFHPSSLPLFAALRVIVASTVFLITMLQADLAIAPKLMLSIFLSFSCSRLFVTALKFKAKRRERLLSREMSPLVDILIMVLNSGISIDQSLRYVSDILGRTAPLSTIVLHRYVADIDNGMPFEAAFERLGQRFGTNEGYDLANLIRQSLLQGGEILNSLESFGTELSDKRVAAAREQIGRKSVLLTLTMLAFFMPVLMITLGGPAVSRIMHTLNSVKHELHHRGTRR